VPFTQDLRYAARTLRQSPAFLATSVLTLAVGLGLITVAFTVFNAYVLRPFAVRDPSSLCQIGWRGQDAGGQSFTWRQYLEVGERRDLFDDALADHTRFMTSDGRTLSVAFVSDNYFAMLGPRLRIGRAFDRADSRQPVAVLSAALWARLYDGDPGVLGREIDLDGRRFTIIGVVRSDFTGLDDAPRDLWVPLTTYAAMIRPDLIAPNGPRQLEVVARLRRGVTGAQAEAALTPQMTQMIAAVENARDVRANVSPQSTPNPLSLDLLAVLSPVFAAFVLVLVAACANVSNVMLARAIAREREIAVRLSLGATRWRIVRQLLTEGLLIALLGGAAGLALAAWSLRVGIVVLFRTLPPSFAALLRVVPLDFDHRVFLFAFAAASLTTLVFALVPALQASAIGLTDALRGIRSGTRRSSRLRSALVVAQVAVSLFLVIVALTLARNSAAMGAAPLGFDTRGVQSINIRAQDASPIRAVAPLLASDPRVAELAVTGGNPLFERTRMAAAAPLEGASAQPTRYTFVSPEYFSILRIPIVNGRVFRTDEARASAPVAVVSAATARAFWPGEDPIGKTLRIERANGRPVDEVDGYPQVTVVGVARDVVSGLLVDGEDAGHIYLPTHAADAHATALLLRARSPRDLPPHVLRGIYRRVVADPDVFETVPLDEIKAAQVYPLQAASWIGSVLGAIALVLSVSGLYGVLAYMLNQRTKDIGIRMALGATAGAIIRLVMAQSARMAVVGIAVAVIVARIAMKALSAIVRLQEVSFLDATAFVIGIAVVLMATALATWSPARRATKVDPAHALRADG